MDIVCLRHLVYVLMPAVTVFWGESLRARFLQRGARRAIRLLLAALLAWQSLRLLKYMAALVSLLHLPRGPACRTALDCACG